MAAGSKQRRCNRSSKLFCDAIFPSTKQPFNTFELWKDIVVLCFHACLWVFRHKEEHIALSNSADGSRAYIWDERCKAHMIWSKSIALRAPHLKDIYNQDRGLERSRNLIFLAASMHIIFLEYYPVTLVSFYFLAIFPKIFDTFNFIDIEYWTLLVTWTCSWWKWQPHCLLMWCREKMILQTCRCHNSQCIGAYSLVCDVLCPISHSRISYSYTRTSIRI